MSMCCGFAASIACSLRATAQLAPDNGMRPADIRWDAISHTTAFITPQQKLSDCTIVMRDGRIVAVGPSASTPIPQGATEHDGRSWTVTAGFIEPCLMIDSATAAKTAASEAAAHWNPHVTPQIRAQDLVPPNSELQREMRALGFTVAALYPNSGVFRGSGSVVLLGEDRDAVRLIGSGVGPFVGMSRARDEMPTRSNDDRASVYPQSQMGVVALIRQTLRDARWRKQSAQAWADHPQVNAPPTASPSLDALAPAVNGGRVFFDCASWLEPLRACAIGRDCGVGVVILASGQEFRHLDEFAAQRVPAVVPLRFPAAVEVPSERQSESLSFTELAAWAAAPANPSRLIAAGVPVSLTTARLERRSDFPARVRDAMVAGLTEPQLIASLTTEPAALLGLESTLGTIAVGKSANLTVSEGSPFAPESRIVQVWVAGRRIETTGGSDGAAAREFTGPTRSSVTLPSGQTRVIEIDPRKRKLTVTTMLDGGKTRAHNARQVQLQPLQGSCILDGEALDMQGVLRCNFRSDERAITLEVEREDGTRVTLTAAAMKAADDAKTPAESEKADAANSSKAKSDDKKDGGWPTPRPALAFTAPFGDFGQPAPPHAESVLFKSATVWTSAASGIMTDCDVLVQGGRISAVGHGIQVPAATRTIDCTGMHLTPGMIDCHSHTGVDGSVNEATEACSAEVRIGDVIDPDDVNWYRQLAGGVTCVNQLHGSANPIGGQNSVVKLKWGSPLASWPAAGAKPGIKFALGENVVRPRGRYPQTRMGVEAYLRDRFQAALEYRAAQAAFNTNPDRARLAPVREDLELETLAEILEGKRIIHCHSYRQDEILMLLRLADELGFRIGTLQHVLEGYKVADAIARHGAGASCFSDWWAYKMEVMDAIPWAGAIMHRQQVVVSFNSDSNELARRLNVEAAKAVKYGGLDPAAALCFVTIHPARQIGFGERTGSIEVGKDADLALWSGDPLSPMSVCQQTWIDGALHFDRAVDLAMRPTREKERRALILAMAEARKSQGSARDGRGGAASSWMSGESEDENAEAVDSDTPNQPAPPPQRLLSRMIDAREAFLLGWWRSGRPIESIFSRGDCGCVETAP
jgi:N-acetylglucosamine-6-phosphate deacetylase